MAGCLFLLFNSLTINNPLAELFLFALVPVLDGPEVADNAAVDFCLLSAVRAFIVFACYIAVAGANAECWRYGEIRQFRIERYLLDKLLACLCINSFA